MMLTKLYNELIKDISKTIKKSLQENMSLNEMARTFKYPISMVFIKKLDKIIENVTPTDYKYIPTKRTYFDYKGVTKTNKIYLKCLKNIKRYLKTLIRKSDKLETFLHLLQLECTTFNKLFDNPIDPFIYIRKFVGEDSGFNPWMRQEYTNRYLLCLEIGSNIYKLNLEKINSISGSESYTKEYKDDNVLLNNLENYHVNIKIPGLKETNIDLLEELTVSLFNNIVLKYIDWKRNNN